MKKLKKSQVKITLLIVKVKHSDSIEITLRNLNAFSQHFSKHCFFIPTSETSEEER